MQKPILRLFADYCCGFALWNSHEHEILDGSEEQLLEIGISQRTLNLLKVIVDVHDWESAFEDPTPEMATTYGYLIDMAKIQLDREIGEQFEIVIQH
jgi:hypothetical protein